MRATNTHCFIHLCSGGRESESEFIDRRAARCSRARTQLKGCECRCQTQCFKISRARLTIRRSERDVQGAEIPFAYLKIWYLIAAGESCFQFKEVEPKYSELSMDFSKSRRQLIVGCSGVTGLVLCGKSMTSQAVQELGTPDQRRRTLLVGPQQDIKSLREASQVARDGDLVLADAIDYRGDVAVWPQSNLVIRGRNGTAQVLGSGVSAEGKALFVIRGDSVRVEDFAFSGARVPDRNGAGIRLEGGGSLTVCRCRFDDNENGILTSNEASSELHVIDSVFAGNGAGDGQSHNLYAGLIGKLTVTGSYFARARVGHLLKTRARESVIAYSRLSGEDGSSSYELEFPSGGRAVVVGCLVQQGLKSENATIISYGAEGYRWALNELAISFCTVVNEHARGGTFVRVSRGPASAEIVDNLLVGSGSMDVNVEFAIVRNVHAQRGDFADAPRLDFRLRQSAKQVGAAGIAGALKASRELPVREYVHIASSRSLDRYSAMTPVSPGAFQQLAP